MKRSLLAVCALAVLGGCTAGQVRTRDEQTVRMALASGEKGELVTALAVSARWAWFDQMRALIKAGADVNGRLSDQLTPLEYAVFNDQIESAKLLIDAGADVSVVHRNTRGWGTIPAIEYAKNMRNHEMIGVLTQYKPASAAPAPRRPPASAETVAEPARGAGVFSDVDEPNYKSSERPADLALVVGVEQYEHVPAASHAERDAQAVRKHLKALGVPERNIISLAGRRATRSQLGAYLEEWLPKNAKADSRVYFFYSGHGAPDPQTGDAYLVPQDGDPMFLQSTAYPLKKLYASLAALTAKQVVIALDACFSGAGGRSVLAHGARPLVTKTEDLRPAGALTVLAAASGDEITGALDEQGHGMFTYFFLKGLNEGKRGALELHDYLKPRVQDEARRQNRDQTPGLFGGDAKL